MIIFTVCGGTVTVTGLPSFLFCCVVQLTSTRKLLNVRAGDCLTTPEGKRGWVFGGGSGQAALSSWLIYSNWQFQATNPMSLNLELGRDGVASHCISITQI